MNRDMPKSGYLQLLARREFASLLVSQASTNFGDGLFAVVVISYAIRLGASATDLGIVTFSMILPRGLLGPIGGVIADRCDRRSLLIAVELVRILAVIALPLFGMTHYWSFWALAAVGLVVSMLFSIGMPAAKALIPKLVPPRDLQLANSLAQAIIWPAYFIGAGILAAVIQVMSFDSIFYLVATFFAISLLALLALPTTATTISALQDTDSDRPRFTLLIQDMRDGYHNLARNRVLLARVALYGVFTFFWRGILQIVLPIILARRFPQEAGLYGLLMLVNGCGELLTNLVVGKIKSRRPIVQSFYGEVIIGAAAILAALSLYLPDPRVGLYIVVFLVGASASTIDIPLFTVIQREIPEQHLGKVISYWFTIGSIGGSLGTLLGGYALEHSSPLAASGVSGAFLLVIGLAMAGWARRRVSFQVDRQLPLGITAGS